jgi:hypothetical protein
MRLSGELDIGCASRRIEDSGVHAMVDRRKDPPLGLNANGAAPATKIVPSPAAEHLTHSYLAPIRTSLAVAQLPDVSLYVGLLITACIRLLILKQNSIRGSIPSLVKSTM